MTVERIDRGKLRCTGATFNLILSGIRHQIGCEHLTKGGVVCAPFHPHQCRECLASFALCWGALTRSECKTTIEYQVRDPQGCAQRRRHPPDARGGDLGSAATSSGFTVSMGRRKGAPVVEAPTWGPATRSSPRFVVEFLGSSAQGGRFCTSNLCGPLLPHPDFQQPMREHRHGIGPEPGAARSLPPALGRPQLPRRCARPRFCSPLWRAFGGVVCREILCSPWLLRH
jgi:hypothetical protein